ncbi:hypothetical protein C5167_031028 [Papaver somniferum]|nr:hypothetical protein C5167_031028 [Papaver somniferum]
MCSSSTLQQLLIYLDNGYGIGGSAFHLAAAGGIVRCSEGITISYLCYFQKACADPNGGSDGTRALPVAAVMGVVKIIRLVQIHMLQI